MYTFITGVAKNRSMFRCSRQGPRGSGTRCANVSCRRAVGRSIVDILSTSFPRCMTMPARSAAGRSKRAAEGACRSQTRPSATPACADLRHADGRLAHAARLQERRVIGARLHKNAAPAVPSDIGRAESAVAQPQRAQRLRAYARAQLRTGMLAAQREYQRRDKINSESAHNSLRCPC